MRALKKKKIINKLNYKIMEDENKVLEKQNITLIKNDWNGQHFDYEVGTESSADGFELWYLKEKGSQYDICENVYYEESGVIE